MRNELKFRLAAPLFGCLLALLIGEAATRIFFAVRGATAPYPTDSESALHDWIVRNRRGPELEPGSTNNDYRIDLYDPDLGWRLRPLIRSPGLASNSKGLRGIAEFEYSRNERRRIVFLGDSFTFGEGVADEDTFPHRVGRLLEATESLNLGIHGYSVGQMYLYFMKEGIRYRPDIVVISMHWDDVLRDLTTFRDFAKPRLQVADGELRVSGIPVPTPQQVLEQWNASWHMRSQLVDLLRYHTGRLVSRQGVPEALPLAAKILRELKRHTDREGARLVVVLLPGGFSGGTLEQTIVAGLRTCVVDIEATLVDLYEPVERARRRGERLHFDHGHYNPRGNELVAAEIVRRLGTDFPGSAARNGGVR